MVKNLPCNAGDLGSIPGQGTKIPLRTHCCAHSRPTLCHAMDCSLPGSSGHGILQARIFEWVAISFSRDLPDSGIKPASPEAPALAGGFFTTEPPGKCK